MHILCFDLLPNGSLIILDISQAFSMIKEQSCWTKINLELLWPAYHIQKLKTQVFIFSIQNNRAKQILVIYSIEKIPDNSNICQNQSSSTDHYSKAKYGRGLQKPCHHMPISLLSITFRQFYEEKQNQQWIPCVIYEWISLDLCNHIIVR